jgi:hypothetical protein
MAWTGSAHAAQAPRGPLARLVSNPDRGGGLPPFALTDQNGIVQRYVEPVAGIDLRPYVGQVVVVRHDTGQTLLASQLELPPRPLYPMVASPLDTPSRETDPLIQQAQFADNDDATVELLDEGEPRPESGQVLESGPLPPGAVFTDGGYPAFPGGGMPGHPGFGAPGCDPIMCDPNGGPWMPSDDGMAPCPHCGGYHQGPGGRTAIGFDPARGVFPEQSTHFFADVEINFLRLHLTEEAVGKLSEKYEFSPRFVAGFTGIGPLDARARYWLYGRQTRTRDGDDAIRLDFDVLDLEGTHRFGGPRSEVVLAAGLRLASIELIDKEDDSQAGADLLGLTMAADGRTRLASLEGGRLAWVYGGRLSILGGDWGHDDDGILPERLRDDNVVVHELYAGLELARCYRKLDLHARLAFEMQNWHSDVLAESDFDTDSIGILGPGLRLGAEF